LALMTERRCGADVVRQSRRGEGDLVYWGALGEAKWQLDRRTDGDRDAEKRRWNGAEDGMQQDLEARQ
jgi:hypothetical protein